jgi:anti-anti-sigma regulatory factor
MAETTNLTLPAYERAQQALFRQILNAVRLAVIVVLVLSLGGLAFPNMRTIPIGLLAVLLAIQFGVTEAGRWLMGKGRPRAAATLFVVLTLIVATAVAGVLGFPAFAALAGGVLVAISALLIGPRHTFALGAIVILLFIMLSLADRQGWLAAIEITREAWPALLIQIGFVVAATGVLMVVCTLASERLQSSVREARERAAEAERAHAAQAALNQRLEREVGEQRRLLDVIQELETPIMPVLKGVLVLPMVGHMDSRRLEQIEARLLQRVVADRATLVLIDITGVPLIDTLVAGALVRLGKAIRLLGAHVALTGFQPATAQTLVGLGVELEFVKTYATLQDALMQIEDGKNVKRKT